MTNQELFKDFFTEEEVAKLMGFKTVKSLHNRVYAEAGHPPYVETARGKRIYMRDEFLKWARANQKTQRRKIA